MNWRNAFCCISHARVNNILCHNKKVWNFDGVSGALSLCVWVVTCPDLHHIVPVRRGRQSRWGPGPGHRWELM